MVMAPGHVAPRVPGSPGAFRHVEHGRGIGRGEEDKIIREAERFRSWPIDPGRQSVEPWKCLCTVGFKAVRRSGTGRTPTPGSLFRERTAPNHSARRRSGRRRIAGERPTAEKRSPQPVGPHESPPSCLTLFCCQMLVRFRVRIAQRAHLQCHVPIRLSHPTRKSAVQTFADQIEIVAHAQAAAATQLPHHRVVVQVQRYAPPFDEW